ncbi:MAG: ABC transporter ATP-binding protein [Candidatus Omnitrophica bacterium]|nr:ABC transporter ATP-binding protein [Candidatus Omnitrophota bacterium]
MLLELKDISKTFSDRAGGKVKAVDGVSLCITAQESCAIVGESGCGKTTLARIAMGLVRPDAGKILFEGQPVWGDRKREQNFRLKVRMVFQDPFASLDPRYSVRAILDEALHLQGRISRDERKVKMAAVLEAVALPADILSRYPHEFSGGERQRLAIARALMTDPALLILDEAVSSLDVIVQKEVLDCLAGLQSAKQLTYLFITHNLAAARRITRKIIVMRSGKIINVTGANDL